MNLAAFLNPGFLWAASLLAVPLIIHLLNRRRVRVVTWAAMDFLLSAFQKRKRRMRLENLLLLLLRCAIPVLLALVMARPFFGTQNLLSLLADDTREVVVVLDHSYSMARQLGAGTAYESAQTQIRRLMDQHPFSRHRTGPPVFRVCQQSCTRRVVDGIHHHSLG